MITFPGPTAALITLPVPADGEGVGRVLTLERAVHATLPDLLETIPAFNTLLVLGEARSWEPERVLAEVPALMEASLAGPAPERSGRTVELPACYHPSLGPDLQAVADAAGLDADAVVEIHRSGAYTVLATGFAPGFAYLGDIDARIAVPRRASPRQRVEVGSIGLADRRTGVYPSTGPGGWQLIGRVPASLFADAEERIARFEPGARVTFRSIALRDFEAEA